MPTMHGRFINHLVYCPCMHSLIYHLQISYITVIRVPSRGVFWVLNPLQNHSDVTWASLSQITKSNVCLTCWCEQQKIHQSSWLLVLCEGIPQVTSWAPSQYPKRRLSVRSRKVSKPRDLYLELSDRSEIWPALRQQCCRCACQISKRYYNLKYHSRGFETLRDLTIRRLFGYWDGAQNPLTKDQ